MEEQHNFESQGLQPSDWRWRRGRLLGIGGHSSVYLATRQDDGLQFAVKSVVLDCRDQYEKKALETLRHEINLLHRLESKYIVKYLGYGFSTSSNINNIERGTLDMYMEYLPRGNLTSLVQWYWHNKRKQISEIWIATYTLDILRALEYLHKNEIVHGDIKGENALFGSNCMKLVDFGSAKDSCVSKLSLVLEGTKRYMAPEVESQVESTYASDVFSLGCVFLEMATGEPPNETLKGQQYSKSIPTSMSRDAQDFLQCCLKTDPKQRHSASQLLNHVFILNNMQIYNPSPRPRISNADIFPYDCRYLSSHPSDATCYKVHAVDKFPYSGPRDCMDEESYSTLDKESSVQHEEGASGGQIDSKALEEPKSQVVTITDKQGVIMKLDIARASVGVNPQLDAEELAKALSEYAQTQEKSKRCCCSLCCCSLCCNNSSTNVVEQKTPLKRSYR